jgi:hypothetical protein
VTDRIAALRKSGTKLRRGFVVGVEGRRGIDLPEEFLVKDAHLLGDS